MTDGTTGPARGAECPGTSAGADTGRGGGGREPGLTGGSGADAGKARGAECRGEARSGNGPGEARGGDCPGEAGGGRAAGGPTGPGAWHVGGALAAAYAAGTVREPDAWSLEKHLEGCARCAADVSAAVRETAAGAVVADVRAAVLAAVPVSASRRDKALSLGRLSAPGRGGDRRPRPGHGRRRERGDRYPEPAGPLRTGWFRAAGPALGRGWLGALAAVVAGAFALSYGTGSADTRPLLLALAPALPPAGVALSYGRHADPLHEIAAATPSGGLRLLLTRSAVVLALSVTLLTATGALLPAASGAPGAAAWLLPALALTAGSLALGTWTGLRTAAAVLAGGWLAFALLPAVAAGPGTGRISSHLAPLLSGAGAQAYWAAAAALCAGLLVLRRSSFDHPEKA
ncbi:zf-HC2 domain-containing protein [Streptomyces sp. NPDC003691]